MKVFQGTRIFSFTVKGLLEEHHLLFSLLPHFFHFLPTFLLIPPLLSLFIVGYMSHVHNLEDGWGGGEGGGGDKTRVG